ncbi:hypothetical protein LP419_11180 [Massilia sp. H-1]|nr:hypothetical protein LP419_11180 [Massilia sp. H-1]
MKATSDENPRTLAARAGQRQQLAAADTISAQRYVDAQGVEVIQNRSPAPTA